MNTHGGKRAGAGAPKGPRQHTADTCIQVRVTQREKCCIKRRAAARNMSVSEYVKICTLSGRDE